MNSLDLVDSFAATIASALGFGIIQAAAFAAVVFLFARMSRTSATTRHVLWWIALSVAVALPFASVAASLGRIEHHTRIANVAQAARARSEDEATTARIPASASRPVLGLAPRATIDSTDGATPFSRVTTALSAAFQQLLHAPHLATVLIAVWLGVAATGLAMLARSLVSLARIKRGALPLDESVVRRLRRWRHSTRIGRAVELRVSNEVDVPVAVGFRTPTILLPARVVEMEEIGDLDQIAMHEYAHLDRYDDWTNLAQRVVERIFWFNPIVLFAGRQISLEREIACDDWVIAQTGRAHRYATCLWKLVESARFPMSPIVAPGALLSAKQITRRIEQLLDSRRNALPRLSPLGAIGLGLLAVAVVVVQTERAPVIAIEDAPSVTVAQTAPVAPAAPAVPLRVAVPVPIPSQRPAPERPRSAPSAREAERPIVVQVPRPTTPEAIASERARTLSERDHDVVVKAELERAIHRDADVAVSTARATAVQTASAAADEPTIAIDGEKLGLDLAKTVATSVVDGILGDTADTHTPSTLDRETIQHCLGCDLEGRDLRGIDLHGLSLMGDDLRGADLRGVNLAAVTFVGVDLRNARIDGANLKDASLNGCDLRGLDLRGRDLRGVRLTGADMRAVDLRDADLSHAKFEGDDLRGARFEGADVVGATFSGCQLKGVDLNALKGATRIDGNLHAALDDTQGLNEVSGSRTASRPRGRV
jgi:beta-lactamase regulating signal transducer with metallopeptidase domain